MLTPAPTPFLGAVISLKFEGIVLSDVPGRKIYVIPIHSKAHSALPDASLAASRIIDVVLFGWSAWLYAGLVSMGFPVMRRYMEEVFTR